MTEELEKPLVSVIIPSFNSMTGNKNIDNTIESIENQTYTHIETIVIDNFSEDSTFDACKKHRVLFFQLRAGRSRARNLGIEKMKGEYALFVDSDHLLSSTLVADCINKVLSTGASCLKIPVYFVSTGKSRIDCSEMRNLEFKSGIGEQTLLLFFSKNLIHDIKFPESVELGEDVIFSSKALMFNPIISTVSSNICHTEEGSIESLIVRSWNYGKKFRLTRREIGSASSTRLLLSLSAFNTTKLKRIVSSISISPVLLFSFILYIFFKHFAFIISWGLSNLTRKKGNF